MFTRWGDLVYRFRFAVIGVVGAALLALGGYGFGLENHLSSSGLDDPGSESSQAARIADAAFGRNHDSDIVVMYNAPEGKTIDDPQLSAAVVENLSGLAAKYPDSVDSIVGTYWRVGNAPAVPSTFGSKDKKHAFAAIRLKGNNDTETLRSYRATKDAFNVAGVDTEVSGLQGMAGTLNDTIAHDTKRMELLAIPAVGVLLFFIFGGIVAAALPLIIGGLTILGANGIIMALTNFTEVNSFVSGVVSMIGLGLAIDYGLFIVSRFREELAEGYDTRAAVRRSVMTAGRTVVFSATMIVASLGGILLFPQGFLRSIAYGTIATVTLAALTSITILPAMLAILGPRVDMLGLKRFRKDKTAEEIENGFWGNMTRWVMKHPLKIAIPITIGLLLLIIPVKDLAFGGINEKYLPPDNSTRLALEHFYEVFPMKKTDPIEIIFTGEDTKAIGTVLKQVNQAPGLVSPFGVPSSPRDDRSIWRTSATLVDSNNADQTIDYLRAIEVPDDIQMYVGGQPAIQKDSIDALLKRIPLMIALVLLVTTVLMFLTFGSLVLPIKAAVMSALGLGSTLGILTWIFIDGHGSGILNFTPQPISAPVLVLIIAIIYGLSTDYEVFLLSRMVEARAEGASTTEAVRIGTAQTGRIITAAALILLVVTGAFAFSDLVMMQYIAYGMIAALFIDATVLRMLLVPAIMKLLGDDCWWAPKWMKRIQERIGLGEPILDDERPQKGAVVDLVKTTPITDPPTMQMTAVPDSKLARTPRRVRTVAEIEANAPTQRMEGEKPSRRPVSPDPTRPRAAMLSDNESTQVLPAITDDAPNPTAGPSTPAPGSAAGPHPSGLNLGPHGSAPLDGSTPDGPGGSHPNDPGASNPANLGGHNVPADGSVGTSGPTLNLGGSHAPSTAARPPRGSARIQPPAGFSTPLAGVSEPTAAHQDSPRDLPSVTPRLADNAEHDDATPANASGRPDAAPTGDSASHQLNMLGNNTFAPDNARTPSPRASISDAFGAYTPPVPHPSDTSRPDATLGNFTPPDAPQAPDSVTPSADSLRPETGAANAHGQHAGLSPTDPAPGFARTDPSHATSPSNAANRLGDLPTRNPEHRSPEPFNAFGNPTQATRTPEPGTFTSAAQEPEARQGEPTPTRFSSDVPARDGLPGESASNGTNPFTSAPAHDALRDESALNRTNPFGPATPGPGFGAPASTRNSEFGAPASTPDSTFSSPTSAPNSQFGAPTGAPDSAFGEVPTPPNSPSGTPSNAPNSQPAGRESGPTTPGFATNEPPAPGFQPVTFEPRPPIRLEDLDQPNGFGTPSAHTPADQDWTAPADAPISERPNNFGHPPTLPGFTAIDPNDPTPTMEPTPAVSPDAPEHTAAPEPRTEWQAPEGFTPVGSTQSDPDDQSRNEIENWMAQLRSSRRGATLDEGRHHGAEGRTVSVNELLRRREDDDAPE
ncbi:MMPL family transporter [Nocardia camponoti]|uniref:Membrane transport protein MMPL domain-containing protein n=1 Tax=Nocardia camponoti TaxID=1616106 RepID=A0A917QIX4_9NOCA|nr:hypothetical protein GCM10011591_25970 [Nocardia camponoti]